MMFAFRGVKNGLYRVSTVDESGQSTANYECTKPCAVIKRKTYYGVTRMSFNPASVIGLVFTDAFAGNLRLSRDPSEVAAQAPAASVPSANFTPTAPTTPEVAPSEPETAPPSSDGNNT